MNYVYEFDTYKHEASMEQEEDEQIGIKTRNMVRRKEEQELKKQFEGRMTRGKTRALEQVIKRINRAFEETW